MSKKMGPKIDAKRKSSIATPLRVRNDGPRNSTSIQRSGRLSSVRPGRPSLLASASRRSSIKENRKDLRLPVNLLPTSKYVESLNMILTELGYSNAIPPRFDNNPSRQDLENIFDLIISLFSVQYNKKTSKFENEYPRMMKLLHYPYNVNKPQLPPNAPMRKWATTLYELVWLCNCAKYYYGVKVTTVDFQQDFTYDNGRLVAHEMNMQGYLKYMSEVDDHDMDCFDEEFIKQLPSKLGLEQHLKQMGVQESELSEKEAELNVAKETQEMLANKHDGLQMDIKKLNSYLQQMDIHNSKLDVVQQKFHRANTQLGAEIEDLKHQIKAKELIISSQKMTIQEVQQLKAVCGSLDSQITECEEVLHKQQAELLKVDLELINEQNELDVVIEDYRNIALECKMLPVTGSNAQGFDYNIIVPKFNSENLSSNLETITGRLKVILKQWKEAVRKLETEEVKSKLDIDQLNEIHQSKTEENGTVDAKRRREQESIDVKKKELSREIQQMKAELTFVEDEISHLNEKYKKVCAEIEYCVELYKRLQSQLQQRMTEKTSKSEKNCSSLLDMAEVCFAHKKRVEDRFRLFQERFAKICEQKKATMINLDLEKIESVCLQYEELERKCENLRNVNQ